MSAPTANWSYPTAIRFGAGRIKELADACRAAGIERPLLVTDAGLAKLPITARARRPVEGGRASGRDLLRRAVEPGRVERRGRHRRLSLPAAMTASSPSAAARASTPARSSPSWPGRPGRSGISRISATGGRGPTPDKIAPVVAVPTTAGTGSEVGRAGVVTQEATHTKKVIFHPKMMPKVVICDPELTVGMPPSITAGTGMDALAHCLEAYCAPSYHPIAEGIAVEGMRLVFDEPAKGRGQRQRSSRRAPI